MKTIQVYLPPFSYPRQQHINNTGNPLLLTRSEANARVNGQLAKVSAATYVIVDAVNRVRHAAAVVTTGETKDDLNGSYTSDTHKNYPVHSDKSTSQYNGYGTADGGYTSDNCNKAPAKRKKNSASLNESHYRNGPLKATAGEVGKMVLEGSEEGKYGGTGTFRGGIIVDGGEAMTETTAMTEVKTKTKTNKKCRGKFNGERSLRFDSITFEIRHCFD